MPLGEESKHVTSSDTMLTADQAEEYSSGTFAVNNGRNGQTSGGRRSTRGSKKKKGTAVGPNGQSRKLIPSETGSHADEEEKLNL